MPTEFCGMRGRGNGGQAQSGRALSDHRGKRGVDEQRQTEAPCSVLPSPATHAILTVLKAGETVYQAGELPGTLRVSKIHYEPP